MKESDNDNTEQEFYSIRDVLRAWRFHYADKRKVFYVLHMSGLIPVLVIRYAILSPIIKFLKDLWNDQNGSLYRINNNLILT